MSGSFIMHLFLNSALPRGSAMINDNKPGFLGSVWRCTMYLPDKRGEAFLQFQRYSCEPTASLSLAHSQNAQDWIPASMSQNPTGPIVLPARISLRTCKPARNL